MARQQHRPSRGAPSLQCLLLHCWSTGLCPDLHAFGKLDTTPVCPRLLNVVDNMVSKTLECDVRLWSFNLSQGDIWQCNCHHERKDQILLLREYKKYETKSLYLREKSVCGPIFLILLHITEKHVTVCGLILGAAGIHSQQKSLFGK